MCCLANLRPTTLQHAINHAMRCIARASTCCTHKRHHDCYLDYPIIFSHNDCTHCERVAWSRLRHSVWPHPTTATDAAAAARWGSNQAAGGSRRQPWCRPHRARGSAVWVQVRQPQRFSGRIVNSVDNEMLIIWPVWKESSWECEQSLAGAS